MPVLGQLLLQYNVRRMSEGIQFKFSTSSASFLGSQTSKKSVSWHVAWFRRAPFDLQRLRKRPITSRKTSQVVVYKISAVRIRICLESLEHCYLYNRLYQPLSRHAAFRRVYTCPRSILKTSKVSHLPDSYPTSTPSNHEEPPSNHRHTHRPDQAPVGCRPASRIWDPAGPANR